MLSGKIEGRFAAVVVRFRRMGLAEIGRAIRVGTAISLAHTRVVERGLGASGAVIHIVICRVVVGAWQGRRFRGLR